MDPFAPAARGIGPARKAAREHSFELGADRLRKDRRRALRRNPDHERRAIDNGAERKIAMRRPIDDIDRNAGCARRGGKTFGAGVILEAADRNGGAGEVPRAPSPLSQSDRCARMVHRQGAQLLARVLGKDLDMSAGRRQKLCFPRHRRAVAGDERALALEIKENRQSRERLHARRARLPVSLEHAHQYTSC